MLAKLVFLFLLVQLANAAVRLPIRRLESRTERLLREGRHEEYRAFRNEHLATRFDHGRVGGGNQSLRALSDTLHTVTVRIGEPPQNFTALIDTTISSLWVPDISWVGCEIFNISDCYEKTRFDPSQSRTYQKDKQHGNLTQGIFGYDKVWLADGSQHSSFVVNATFVQATSAWYYLSEPIDGILGLNLRPDPRWDADVDSVFGVAVQSMLVFPPVFTLWLPSNNDGSITYGWFDYEHCNASTVSSFRVVDGTNDWTIPIDAIAIDRRVILKSAKALVDIGTREIIVPSYAQERLVAVTNATYSFIYGQYEVDCNVKFSFSIISINAGINLIVNEKTAVWKADNDTCLLAISDNGFIDDHEYVLGEPFVQNRCLVYDMQGRISFADAKH